MSGELMLKHAATLIAERRKTYGEPTAALDAVAKRWSITLGQPVTAAQVAICLIDLKLARLTHDPKHQDSLLDVAGYAALLHEVVR
jgi:hypothetical protein